MVEWAHAFDAPIHLHASDREWVMRPDPSIKFWHGDTLALARGVTLIRCGGHFAGGTVLHWAQGAGGRGALLSGDIVQVIPDRKFVTFMRSYPNMIPLSAPAVERIGAMLEPIRSTPSTAPGSTAPFPITARTSSNARSPATWRRCAATVRPNYADRQGARTYGAHRSSQT